MGSIMTKQQAPVVGTVMEIVHNAYSDEQEFPNDVFRTNQPCRVIKIAKAYQSRPTAPPLTICHVQFQDKHIEAYPVSNLKGRVSAAP
jgi:hypothetical protein